MGAGAEAVDKAQRDAFATLCELLPEFQAMSPDRQGLARTSFALGFWMGALWGHRQR